MRREQLPDGLWAPTQKRLSFQALLQNLVHGESMKQRKPSRVASLLIFFSLSAQLCAGAAVAGTTTQGAAAPPDKVSPEIRERLRLQGAPAQTAGIILQLSGRPSGRLNALLNRNGVHVRAHFNSFNSLALDLPLGVVEELASFAEARYVSTDAAVHTLGHVTATTGADAARSSGVVTGSTTLPLDGAGV